ncbi:glucan endo-1,6-beta-glucosidase B [Penicillium alfredii]|uniref:glucan endo-1,6-beta-glucosidase n=1 Tax=Penicillium alfredii TaxID=1506179 RepID=A0A9W9ENC8_9EURO|nr:glucan endo-1,6-beta-glucosidase B [Penicillium alfredii]KAJ5084889.1 glucan endo-1,6-beta-glucosidase B [Penicillium alfredii]
MAILSRFCMLSALAGLASAWLAGDNKEITSKDNKNLFSSVNNKVRGVNLGSQFIFEPWLGESAWSDMGCSGRASEFDCVSSMGQKAANESFAKHWGSWITQDDISEMVSYGLNTIRVPVGYWLREDLVDSSEHFPQGGLEYVQKLCGWASDAGLYIIMDLHGAPEAQTPNNAFTGQNNPNPGFYQEDQYERALKFLEWMAEMIHRQDEFRNVGMLEVLNEPMQDNDKASSMRENYYPKAFERIRAVETKLSVDKKDYLHIQMMDKLWGSGDPTEHLDDQYYAAYDDHRYYKWDKSVETTHDNYISTSCKDKRDSNSPTIVGEWSLAVPKSMDKASDWQPNSSNADFYRKWFAAQVHSYEQGQGWVFWTWKSQLNDYRWSYQDAVKAGVIPKDFNSLEDVCG